MFCLDVMCRGMGALVDMCLPLPSVLPLVEISAFT